MPSPGVRLTLGIGATASLCFAGWLLLRMPGGASIVDSDAVRRTATTGHVEASGGATGPELRGAPPSSTRPAPTNPAPVPAPTGALLVTILDADERPVAGVTVAIVAVHEKRREQVLASTSDALGRVVLDGSADLVDRWRSHRPGVRFVVEAAVPLPHPPELDLGEDPSAHGSVTLRLPRAPRLEVDVVDESGALLMERSTIYLFWRAPGAGSEWRRVGLPSAVAVDGHARFEIVPPGLELLLRSTGTESRFWAETTLPSQFEGAGIVHARIALGMRRERIRVRVTDAASQPLARVSLSVGFLLASPEATFTPNSRQRPLNTIGAETGADGVLSLTLPMAAQLARCRVLYVERPASRPETSDRITRLIAFRPVDPGLLPGTEVDLGDLRLGAEVLFDVVEGRVVDDDDRPLEGAAVDAQYWNSEQGLLERVGVSAPVVTGPDGAFTLRAPHAPLAPVALSASKQGYGRVEVEAVHGARGIVLRLPRR